ncbi:hypothetical protein ACOJUR_08645 [Alicyclobacillus tolerans]|uniref:Phosphoglycerol transferase MdoB-like AlkP superfamily enzyme n=2 Tax=Alicyclobacillus tolerans TaxID=90970 RepID=A0ABT9LZW2_9BACL|nr:MULTISPECIES: hypothetical protein [Alicyclobacillus]MCY0871106.1 hypothetical protein [Bacillota bacterium]MDP9729819.1 phosphoglycerol transferase MdoB-like AlkP superfamily enzyme [Alicyclobacillus tengchongensis]QRF23521.1 hypothetical protein FY534_07450 [Alicyclobacillus sp. TC]
MLFNPQTVASGPLFNLMRPFFGILALVALGYFGWRILHMTATGKRAALILELFGILFVLIYLADPVVLLSIVDYFATLIQKAVG